ncbi:MAG: hypothetical protein K0U45_01540 [Alphaproteobacteria bacterium]|nr:hypothetical protein [Alphaproteobacteria bacterium]
MKLPTDADVKRKAIEVEAPGAGSLRETSFAKQASAAKKIIMPAFDASKIPHADIFDKSFRIDFNQALPAFKTDYAVAYRVTKQIDGDADYFVTISSSNNPPRLSQITQFQAMKSQNLMLPLGWDLVTDINGVQFPVILFNLPRGEPLIPDIHAQFQPQTAAACVQRFLQPILPCVNEMHTQGITYRAFSPTNLFIDVGGTRRDYLLGQCLSDPPGTMQHIIFETITAGMAERPYRGKEISGNDIYALGVMMVCLMRGSMPMVHMSDYDILRRKLNLGSFNALTEGMSIAQGIIDPLRGLLADSPNDRWNLEQIYAWLNGRNTDKKTRSIKARSKINFHYQHNSYNSAPELAAVFAHDWDDAVEQTINPDIPVWMRHGVSDEATSNMIRELQNHVNSSGGVASKYDFNLHVAFAKMLFLMNPYSPIVFQNLRFTITGFGHLYAHYFNSPNSAEMNLIRALISVELINYWYINQKNRSTVYNSTIQEIALARQAISLERLEFGFERLLYVLYPDLPCLSPLFDKEFVFDLNSLLEALNKKLSQHDPNEYQFTMDRHLISYIGNRFRRNIANVIRASTEPRSADTGKAQVLLLSLLQEDFNKRPFPALCHHACKLLEPAVLTYNNVNLQNRLRQRLQNTAESGWLSKLLNVIEDQKLLMSDSSNYFDALNEYSNNANLLNELERTKEHINADIKTRANHYALLLCFAIASFGVLILFF